MQILHWTVKQKKINDDCEQTLCSIVELQDFIPEVHSLYCNTVRFRKTDRTSDYLYLKYIILLTVYTHNQIIQQII